MGPDILQHRLTEWECIKMSKSLYLECGSGISGDMTVAALLDLGADQEVLEKALASLQLPGYKTAVTRVKKSGLDACDFNVILDAEHENHDHDMAYLHGDMAKAHAHGEEHVHHHEHMHDHEYVHKHEHTHVMSMYMTRNIHTAMTRNTQESISTIMSTAACRRFLPLSAAVI